VNLEGMVTKPCHLSNDPSSGNALIPRGALEVLEDEVRLCRTYPTRQQSLVKLSAAVTGPPVGALLGMGISEEGLPSPIALKGALGPGVMATGN